jgi:protein ImuB
MSFAAVYVPNFMVQAVARAEPDLRDAPVALLEGNPPLWKVIAANPSALQAGIYAGMGGSQAAEFTAVQVRPRSPEQEKSTQAALLDVGWSVSPRIEDTAPGMMVVDLDGLGSLFSSTQNIAATLGERAGQIGLRTQIAVASNIATAIHAARGFSGITLIPMGEEAARLVSLPIDVLLPHPEMLETLDRWGIRTCGALASLPTLQLSERLGQPGILLQKMARGASHRSLVLAEPETCFTEEMALDYAVTELEPLAFLLCRLLDQVCARLQARSLSASAFNLQLELQDRMDDEPKPPKRPASRGATKHYEKILRLPVPVRDSKMLLKLLRLQLQSDPPCGSIVKIVLTAEPARPRAGQKGLFVPDAPDPEKLEVTVARLANLVGNSNVGSPQLVDTHRPGEFRMVPFLPASEESATLGKPRGAAPPGNHIAYEPKLRRAAVAFRAFRPELAARVEWQGRSPRQVWFRGLSGSVVTASGPWSTSGDWWDKHGWRQDEWDVEIHFSSGNSAPRVAAPDGLYRIYYDWARRNWFVRGRYD